MRLALYLVKIEKSFEGLRVLSKTSLEIFCLDWCYGNIMDFVKIVIKEF